MPGDLNTVWRELENLERRIAAPAPHDAHHGPDWFDDWRARLNRVQRVRAALSQSGAVAQRLLAERLSGIDLSVVGEILLSACKDIALVWGASILLGGGAGALIGFFGFGVGAVPGAAAGAVFGTQVGAWVLGFLGLKALIEDLGTAIPDALRHYETGFKLAWGPVRRWEQDEGTHRAPYELAEGHLVLMVAMLSALMAYLTRGRGDPGAKARILQEIRESPRLGPKVADWVVANEDKLTRHPSLKPKEQQVTMSSQAKPPAAPPVTPTGLRRLKDETETPVAPAPTGPRVVVARDAVNLQEFRRLNVPDPATKRPRPGEAGAAVEMQGALGGPLNRASPGASADFDIATGLNAGKSVDFMLTPDNLSQAAKINQYFEQNLKGFEATLKIHLNKADVVPMDTRFLTPRNNELLMDVISRVPPQQQAKIILIK